MSGTATRVVDQLRKLADVDYPSLSSGGGIKELYWDNVTLKLKGRPRLEVELRDYCVGDGATDDTAGFRAAVAATPTGGTLEAWNGAVFVLNDTVTFPNDYVTLDLKGAAIRQGQQASGDLADAGYLLSVAGRTGVKLINGRILAELAPATRTQFWQGRINLDGSTRCRVQDWPMIETDGIPAVLLQLSNYCRVTGCYTSNGGVSGYSSSHNKILNNIFDTSPDGQNLCGMVGYGVVGTPDTASYNEWRGNTFLNWGRVAFEDYANAQYGFNHGTEFLDNWVGPPRVDKTAFGFAVSLVGSQYRCAGNTILDSPFNDIEAGGSGGKVYGNTIIHTGPNETTAILVNTSFADQDAQGAQVFENHVTGAQIGIGVFSAAFLASVQIGGNTCTDCIKTGIDATVPSFVQEAPVVTGNVVRFTVAPTAGQGRFGIKAGAAATVSDNKVYFTADTFEDGVNDGGYQLEGNNLTLHGNTLDAGGRSDDNFFPTFSSGAYTGWSLLGNRVFNYTGPNAGFDAGKASVFADPATGRMSSSSVVIGDSDIDAVFFGPDSRLGIKTGAANKYGLAIQLDAAQNADALVVLGSGPFPTTLMRIDAQGRIGSGVDPSSVNAQVASRITETGDSQFVAAPVHSQTYLSTTVGQASQYATGLYGGLTLSPDIGDTLTEGISGFVGSEANITMIGPGTVTGAAALDTTVTLYGGTLGSVAGLRVNSPADASSGAGNITSAYGVRIAQQDVGGVGTGYGVFQEGAPDLNYFAGYLGLGTPAPTARLEFPSSIAITDGIKFFDTSLYRSAAQTIRVDHNLDVGGTLTVSGTDLATQAELDAHSADTTDIHGIADTAALVLTSDSRLSNSRTPTGSAGGVLSGTYPNPGFAVDMATQAELDAAISTSTTGAVILAPTTSARNVIQPTGAAIIPLIAKGFSGQSANLQEWQSSAAAVLAAVRGTDGFIMAPGISKTDNTGPYLGMGASSAVFASRAVGHIPVVARGFAGQTGNLQEWQDSASAITARISSSGQFVAPGFNLGTAGTAESALKAGTAGIGFFQGQGSAALTTLQVKGIASQSADLQQWMDSAGTVMASVGIGGKITLGDAASSSTQMLVRGGASGGPMVTLIRTSGGTTQFSWSLAGGGLAFRDDTSGFTVGNFYGTSGVNQFFVGLSLAIAADTRPSLVSAQTFQVAAGNDVPASDLRLQGGLGTGAGAPGNVVIRTGTTAASGSLHTSTDRVTVAGSTGIVTVTASGKTALSLSSTGTDTGITLGGDTNLYRAGANSLKTDDILTIAAPTSTSTAAFSVSGTLTATAGGAIIGVNSTIIADPASTSTSEFRSLNMSAQVPTQNAQTLGILKGAHLEVRYTGTGSITGALIGAHANVTLPAAALSFGTIAKCVGLSALGFNEFATGGTITGTITTVVGVEVTGSSKGSAGVTVTTNIGIDVLSQTIGATDIGVRIAKADTYALQLSDATGAVSGGITWGTDTNLYRSAADTLKTDDNFIVTGNLTVTGSISGTITGMVKLAPTASANNVIQGTGAAVVPITLKGFAGQTALLQEFQDSTGATLAGVDAAGNVISSGVGASGGGSWIGIVSGNRAGIQIGDGGWIRRELAGALRSDAGWRFFNGSTTAAISVYATGATAESWYVNGSGQLWWGVNGTSVDTNLYRASAGVLKTDYDFAVGANQTLTAAGYHQFTEIAEPAAGAANQARLFSKDNGSGKTQLCVRFPSGASQVLATEP